MRATAYGSLARRAALRSGRIAPKPTADRPHKPRFCTGIRRDGYVGLLAALLAAGTLLINPTEVVKAQQYSKDQGYFYRFRAGFEIKGTGEKLDFDYVVACNIRLTRWRDGGLSNDTTFSPRIGVDHLLAVSMFADSGVPA